MTNNAAKIKRLSLAMLILMAGLSISSLFNLGIAGNSVIVGVVWFFIDKGKHPWENSGLDEKAIRKNLSGIKIWLWILLPTMLNFAANGLSTLIMPEFLGHILSRTGHMLSFDKILILLVQLVVAAIGEEIAWRAFFQKQVSKIMPPAIAIVITSVLFSLGHLSSGELPVVIYDLIFVALNSVVYGIVFQKTNNAWISALSHLIANATSILVFVILG